MQREPRGCARRADWRIADCPLIFPSGSLIGVGIIRIIKHPTPGCNRRPTPAPASAFLLCVQRTFFANPLHAAFHQLLNIISLIPQCRCYPLFYHSLFYQCGCKITRQLRVHKLNKIGLILRQLKIHIDCRLNGIFMIIVCTKFIGWRTMWLPRKIINVCIVKC